MSTFPTDAPWLFHSSPRVLTLPVNHWRDALRSDPLYLQCMVERIAFCKCKASKQYEFLLIHFRHPTLNHVVPVVVDRAMLQESEDTSSMKKAVQYSVLKSPRLSNTPAADVIHLLGNECHLNDYLERAFDGHTALCVVDFAPGVDRPSAMQVATLLSVVHHEAPQYDGARDTHAARSRFHGFQIGMAGSVAAVFEKYASEWETTVTEVRSHLTIRMAEQENLRASAREEGLEAGRAENQAELEHIKAKWAKDRQLCAEAQAEVEAARRMKAENDLLRAQLAAAERRVDKQP
ncbi:hypothetical protein M405DRAFT_868627 [Rhizopogon salebrosus TDB-379]|nr:hypothetical protein M405DRAFT_868627 [Rhizopogon salebrosus TDB-379]